MKLAASVTINSLLLMQMGSSEIKDYVLNSLANEISKEVLKHMEVKETKNVYDDTTTYSGTITLNAHQPTYGVIATNTGIPVGAAITGTTGAYGSGSIKIKNNEEFRVAEYVNKNGNITKVELQRLEEDGWTTIPRVKIEEL